MDTFIDPKSHFDSFHKIFLRIVSPIVSTLLYLRFSIFVQMKFFDIKIQGFTSKKIQSIFLFLIE